MYWCRNGFTDGSKLTFSISFYRCDKLCEVNLIQLSNMVSNDVENWGSVMLLYGQVYSRIASVLVLG